jgi:hypothetical protein
MLVAMYNGNGEHERAETVRAMIPARPH